MVGIVGGTLAAHQAGAVIEHVCRSGHSRCAPLGTDINGCQIGTSIEHILHAGHIGRVETAQVKYRHTGATGEHARHACHIGSVETAQIKTRQFIAGMEHIIHACHLAGVQVPHPSDGFKVTHFVEPVVGRRRAEIGERVVKGNMLHIGTVAISYPTWLDGAIVQVIGRTHADAALVVVAERQRIGTRRVPGIGLLGTGAKGTHHGRHQDDKSEM